VKKAKFALAFHCYQPVFNFRREFEKAYNSAYMPLLDKLSEFPEIKASFHYSGNMLEWLQRDHPEHIEKMKKLARRGQIELISGGHFEPVMVLIPERDRDQQIRMNNEIIERIFGVRPRGAWIAERVWEPGLADTLAGAGMEYTIVDDYHILRAGVDKANTLRPCITKGRSGEAVLFPASTYFRYTMPFQPPKITVEHIREMKDKSPHDVPCFFFADDGEKFGAWPYTYQLVHKKGWLNDFFELLKMNSAWLETATYSEVMDTVPAAEIGEVPPSSYAEMMGWSSGDFRNFLEKYPEAGRMHKRMISVSGKIKDMESEGVGDENTGDLRRAKRELFKAQSNCAYWHGTFGGFYLPHLREGVYKHLIKAQSIIRQMAPGKDEDIKLTEWRPEGGAKEPLMENRFVGVFVGCGKGGAVSELDYKPFNVNLANTVSRVKEDYHIKLKKNYASRIKQARKTIMEGGLADIHDVLGVCDKGLKKVLYYDDYQRSSFLTHIFKEKVPWQEAPRRRVSCDNFLKERYSVRTAKNGDLTSCVMAMRDNIFADNGRPFDLEVIKEVSVGTGPGVMFSHRIVKHSGGPVSLRYALEFNLLVWDKEVIAKPRSSKTGRFSLKDMYSGIGVDFFMDREVNVFRYPVYTVNESEWGLKKTFQGVAVLIGDDLESDNGSCAGDMKVTIAIG